MKIYLETLGCQMNRLDSELVAGILRDDGHEMTDDRLGADVILYNTCSVRSHAEDKVYSRLGEDALRKSADNRPIVGVLGCMAQRLGKKLQRQRRVDIVCSPGRLAELAEMIISAAAGKKIIALDPGRKEPRDTESETRMDSLDSSRNPALAPKKAEAFVRIMRGCDKFCTYCIVPFVRGPERSRSWQQIEEEVRKLIDAGKTQITLLGQTVNSYRWTDGGSTVRFSDLLEKISAVGGLRRLGFITSHPIDFGDDVLCAMRDLPNVCPYIHCPAQSGSDAMLKRMGRKYTRAQYDDLVDRARQIVPSVVLAGDFIVGFPGETEADHQASADLIRRSVYKNSFVFKYSPRPGTTATKLPDDVPEEVKKRRNNELLAVQAQVGLEHHRGYVGRTLEVLVRGLSPRAGKQQTPPPEGMTQLTSRTRGDHVVVFDGPELLIGDYVDVEITNANSLTLFGKLVVS